MNKTSTWEVKKKFEISVHGTSNPSFFMHYLYKLQSHLRNLQYTTATRIIYSTTTVYTTYNTIQYLNHYY